MFKEFDHFFINPDFYSGEVLMGKKDLNGNTPEIFFSTSNRSAGKTTFYNGYFVHDFLQNDNKFTLLYRNKYEVEGCAEAFFSDIQKIYFPGLVMKQEPILKGNAFRLLIGYYEEDFENPEKEQFIGTCCGYATSLAAANVIKTRSQQLSDTTKILFDEFQLEDGRYLNNEIKAFRSIHVSLAREIGTQSKYLPVYLIGNLVDIYNPYYESLGITQRLTPQCNYLRGNGWVVEQSFNQIAATKHSESIFENAFENDSYSAMTQNKKYLVEDNELINANIPNRGLYIASVRFTNTVYGIRYIEEFNIYFMSTKPDPSKRILFAATPEDVTENCVFFRSHKMKDYMKNLLHTGRLFFENRAVYKAGLAFIFGKK